jgi:GH15 family glucan-1,4-alpha-glucosidase
LKQNHARQRSHRVRTAVRAYPPISDYALIGDCHTAALISRAGSVDWCCLPRFDSDSCFGRLLDWEHGGHFSIRPQGEASVSRTYMPNTLILVTTYQSGRNSARVIDFFSMREGGRRRPRRELIRIIEGITGSMHFNVAIVPRLDYGQVKPWIFSGGPHSHFSCGSDTGLRIFGDVPFQIGDDHDLRAQVKVSARQKVHIGLQFVRPEQAGAVRMRYNGPAELQAHFKETLHWWRDWSAKICYADGPGPNIVRSAITLKGLTYAPTGAIIAAPTTSLPERIGGERNWDYRYCWIRDSIFTVWALTSTGAESEAEGVRRFIQLACAGNAEDLQVLYGVDGKRRLTEINLNHLEGWRGSRPARIGNGAERQYQADMYGLVVELTWQWSQRGHKPSADYWMFLRGVIEAAIAKWELPDRGIWEVRSRPLHFVHSKVMCWAAVNCGIELAEKYRFEAPLERWRVARDELHAAIEKRGMDHARGIFVRSFGSKDVDAALLLLPIAGFVAHDDERMVRTTHVICEELMEDGLLLRYRSQDGLSGSEGVFLACTFWLVSCLARQGRLGQARRIFARACASANDLGLFAEEYSPRGKEMLGNFPQGLTHLSHIGAALSLLNKHEQHPPRPRRGLTGPALQARPYRI